MVSVSSRLVLSPGGRLLSAASSLSGLSCGTWPSRTCIMHRQMAGRLPVESMYLGPGLHSTTIPRNQTDPASHTHPYPNSQNSPVSAAAGASADMSRKEEWVGVVRKKCP